MAVQFELYKTPMPKGKESKVRYHARPVGYETVNIDRLAYRIHERSTLRISDIKATIEELKNEVAQCLMDGKKVHIDGLGYFQITLSCVESIHNPKDKRVHKVKLKAVKFKADKALKSELEVIEFQRSKIKPHSSALSPLEIDMKLTKYFAENTFITRRNFQWLCGMRQITAYRHIKRLIAENKLQNKGTPYQPIYVPTPGNYRTK